MRLFLLFCAACVAAGFWFSGFVKSGRLPAYLDAHPDAKRNACIEYYWGMAGNLADHKEPALRKYRGVVEKYPDSKYAPLAWYETIHLIDGHEPNENIVREGNRFLARYPSHPKAELVRKKIIFIEHGY